MVLYRSRPAFRIVPVAAPDVDRLALEDDPIYQAGPLVSSTDGLSFARAVTVVLGGVAVATIVPAWRASRTNPLSALRHQ